MSYLQTYLVTYTHTTAYLLIGLIPTITQEYFIVNGSLSDYF
jgi:hypothetical protein